jgi:hypothetical protein
MSLSSFFLAYKVAGNEYKWELMPSSQNYTVLSVCLDFKKGI